VQPFAKHLVVLVTGEEKWCVCLLYACLPPAVPDLTQ